MVKCEENIRADDDFAVRLVYKYSHLEVVKCLVENGADIHAVDDNALDGHLEMVIWK